MKNLAISIILLTILFLSISEVRGAIVSDDCDVCHTVYPGMMKEAEIGEPLEYVLENAICVNCHSNNDRDTIKMLAGVRVPVVRNTVLPLKPLAGGNFYYVARDFGDRKGHNVDGVTYMDEKFLFSPPGYSRAVDPSEIGYNHRKQLACAGANGCHGNRNIEDPFEAILGSHHAEDDPIDGSTTARSYRFLGNTNKVKGVSGLEDDEWNQNKTQEKHNEYCPTIDILCASCHGDFHGNENTGKGSPWFRHPTGIVLPKNGEYAEYNPEVPPPPDRPDVRIYNPDAPVGREKIPLSSTDEVKIGSDIVTCLSCHVAHSGHYDSILRWDYDAVITGEEGKGGCFICHTGK
ncbi:MAG: hypothetical protein AB1610_05750 [Nitrospirota bacterium]